jgi:hypothetical protein
MQASISVIVTFAYGYGGPLDRDFPADTPILAVRDAAINHFRLATEPTSDFNLTHRDQRVSEAATIGEVAGDAPNVVLKLVQR